MGYPKSHYGESCIELCSKQGDCYCYPGRTCCPCRPPAPVVQHPHVHVCTLDQKHSVEQYELETDMGTTIVQETPIQLELNHAQGDSTDSFLGYGDQGVHTNINVSTNQLPNLNLGRGQQENLEIQGISTTKEAQLVKGRRRMHPCATNQNYCNFFYYWKDDYHARSDQSTLESNSKTNESTKLYSHIVEEFDGAVSRESQKSTIDGSGHVKLTGVSGGMVADQGCLKIGFLKKGLGVSSPNKGHKRSDMNKKLVETQKKKGKVKGKKMDVNVHVVHNCFNVLADMNDVQSMDSTGLVAKQGGSMVADQGYLKIDFLKKGLGVLSPNKGHRRSDMSNKLVETKEKKGKVRGKKMDVMDSNALDSTLTKIDDEDDELGSHLPANIKDVQGLKLMHNRLLQWRFANAKAESCMEAHKMEAESQLYGLRSNIEGLREAVERKQIEVDKLRRIKILSTVLEGHMPTLNTWSELEEDYSSSLSEMTNALLNASLRLPVAGVQKVDVLELAEVLDYVSKVMEMTASHIHPFVPKVEETNYLSSELAGVVAGEKALVEECGSLAFKTHASQVNEWSLREHMIQVNGTKTTT